MNISMEKKKKEAVKRMKQWGVFPQTIEQFDKEGKLSASEPPFGACYWVEDERLEKVREFEDAHNVLVYFVIRSYTEFGVMNSYLYVSDYVEEWEQDRKDMGEGIQLVYVYNETYPDLSEFGSIGIQKTVAAGLKRIW